MQGQSGLDGRENVIVDLSVSSTVKDQSHLPVSFTKSNVAPVKLRGIESAESTSRIETEGAVGETSAMTASNSPNRTDSVDTHSNTGPGSCVMHPLKTDAAFSHVMFMAAPSLRPHCNRSFRLMYWFGHVNFTRYFPEIGYSGRKNTNHARNTLDLQTGQTCFGYPSCQR